MLEPEALTPLQPQEDRLGRFREYLNDLPAAWADAPPEQRNQLLRILYQDVWVNGPQALCVRPQSEVEPLFQVREGAAQPIFRTGDSEAPQSEGLSHSMMAGAISMGFGLSGLTTPRPRWHGVVYS